MALRGNLQSMNLPNIVQTMCLEQRQALVVLRRQVEEGVIFFDKGEIVHARVGNLEGEEAVYKLLHWNDGAFSINDNVGVPRRTITTSWKHLLLEGMQQIDEQQAREQAQTNKALSAAEIEYDEALEQELILLLSNLEQLQIKLNTRKNRKRSTQAMQILAEMVNVVVSFSEAWLDIEARSNSLAKALAKAGDLHPAAQLLQVKNNHLTVNVLIKLHGSWDEDAGNRQKMFSQAGKSMLDILDTYFSLFTARFHSRAVAEEYQEVCNVFLADVDKTINKIRF